MMRDGKRESKADVVCRMNRRILFKNVSLPRPGAIPLVCHVIKCMGSVTPQGHTLVNPPLSTHHHTDGQREV